MLTSQEKERIRLEEQYRQEVKRQLEKKESPRFSLLGFLNSNVGSFLLSTVIVGGISFIYNNHQERIKKIEKDALHAHENEVINNRLFTELAHRLNTLSSLDKELEEYESKDIYLAYYGSSISQDPHINAKFFNFRSYYSEYSEYSIIKLVDEIKNFNTQIDLSNLKESLVGVGPDIVNLAQEWFYKINGGQNAPKRVKVSLNTLNNKFYYLTNNKLTVMEENVTGSVKLYYIGDSERVKKLLTTIKGLEKMMKPK